MDDQSYNNQQPRYSCESDVCEQAECIQEIICSQACVAECEAQLFCDVTSKLRCEIKHARCLKELEKLICITNRFLEASAKKEKAIGEVACGCLKGDKECHE